MNLEIYQQLCAESKILWTQHCLQRMQERDISRADVKNGIATGEIIEDYPDDFPNPSCLIFGYTAIMWTLIIVAPHFLIQIFSSDSALIADAVPALKLYFAAFIFMDLQYIGQTFFKSLNKKKHAIFFSLLRKVVIVVPLTYIFPYLFNMGSNGVFLAEPISNVIGGSMCFITMLCTILPELKRMENK